MTLNTIWFRRHIERWRPEGAPPMHWRIARFRTSYDPQRASIMEPEFKPPDPIPICTLVDDMGACDSHLVEVVSEHDQMTTFLSSMTCRKCHDIYVKLDSVDLLVHWVLPQ